MLPRPAMTTVAADPLVTASLFCAGGLDDLLSDLVGPFWRAWRKGVDPGTSYLWFSRSVRRGEHLKLRIHAPEACRRELTTRLRGRARRYFVRLGPAPAPSEAVRRKPPAPIDLDDFGTASFPDRRLHWSHYRRSPAALGCPLLLQDDRYVSLLTTALGWGSEGVLAAFERPEANRRPTWRRGTFLGLVSAAFEVALPDPDERRAYLLYHRDWLIRFPVLQSGQGLRGAHELLRRYEAHVAQHDRAVAREEDDAAWLVMADHHEEGWLVAWQDALGALRRYLEGAAPALARDLDPFTSTPFFPVLFRILHGLANALGLGPAQEGRTYHRLLHASGAAEAQRVPELVPASCAEPQPDPGALSAELVPLSFFDFENEYRWLDLIAASGSAGAAWVERYRAVAGEVITPIMDALRELRGHKFEQGWLLLEHAEGKRASLAAEPSFFHVLGRFYFGVLAYAHFCEENYACAGVALEEALTSLRRALEAEEFLLPVAPLATDMLIKRLHVARSQCRWEEMAQDARALRAVAMDQRPLCTLEDGRLIFHHTIRDFLAGLDPAPPASEKAALYLGDAGLRLSQIEQVVQSLYALPGFVTPCP